MTNDGTDTPVESRETPPGWGERLALWGMAAILALIVSVLLAMAIAPIAGDHAARAVGKGIGMAVFFQVWSASRSVRAFLATASFLVLAFFAFDWLVG